MGAPVKFKGLRAAILRMVPEGASYQEVADAVGCSRAHVNNSAVRMIDDGLMAAPSVGRKPKVAKLGRAAPRACPPPPCGEGLGVGVKPTSAPAHVLPETIRRPPGALYRARLVDGRESPWLSIVPEARDGGRFDWRALVSPAFSLGGSPAGACAEQGYPVTRPRQPVAERATINSIRSE